MAGFIEYPNCELFAKADWFSTDDFGDFVTGDKSQRRSCSHLKWYDKCDNMIGIVLLLDGHSDAENNLVSQITT